MSVLKRFVSLIALALASSMAHAEPPKVLNVSTLIDYYNSSDKIDFAVGYVRAVADIDDKVCLKNTGAGTMTGSVLITLQMAILKASAQDSAKMLASRAFGAVGSTLETLYPCAP